MTSEELADFFRAIDRQYQHGYLVGLRAAYGTLGMLPKSNAITVARARRIIHGLIGGKTRKAAVVDSEMR